MRISKVLKLSNGLARDAVESGTLKAESELLLRGPNCLRMYTRSGIAWAIKTAE